jgi:protein SCO1
MNFKKHWKKYIVLTGVLFLFPLVWLLFFGVHGRHNFNTLPYFSPDHPNGATSGTYTLPDFAFTNQDGSVYTLDSLKGKVWLATFYNTADKHLANITERLLNVNFKYRDEPDIAIVVFSTDPDRDTPQAMYQYVDANTRYNGFPGKWQFLTGNSAAMASYIRNGFFIQDIANEAIFRLVDADGRIRGMYGNTEYHIRDAMEDIALLKKEIDKKRYDERKKQEKP